MKLLKRILVEGKDRVRYASLFHRLAGCLNELRGVVTKDEGRRLGLFAKAYRILAPLGAASRMARRLAPYVADDQAISVWRDKRIDWKRDRDERDVFEISKGLLLKPYVGPSEKGVLMISFEYNWLPLLTLTRRDALFDRYAIICAPSWSPPPFPSVWSMAGIPNADVFVMQSNFRESEWYNQLPTSVTALPLLISHWIHPGFYKPLAHSERDIDILMVANWATFKRHWVLFKALRRLPNKYKIVLVGQPDSGRCMADIEAEAEAFGVRDRLEIRERLGIDEVTSLQCRSKTSLVFSRREGSCVVVAESMFADCPVGLLKGAHVGSSAFVNEETGVLMDESRLAEELQDFVARSASFSARKWAAENISCFQSAELLNESLKVWSLSKGREWTVDVLPFMCRPNPTYLDDQKAEAMKPVYKELREISGVSISGH